MDLVEEHPTTDFTMTTNGGDLWLAGVVTAAGDYGLGNDMWLKWNSCICISLVIRLEFTGFCLWRL